MSIQNVDLEKCTGCFVCSDGCPKKAIKEGMNSEGFLYPIVDKDKCVECTICEKICPAIKEHGTTLGEYLRNKDARIAAFAMKCNDMDTRVRSASGGVFPLLAKEFLAAGGIVYGAAFDEKWRVRHIAINNDSEIVRLQSSKYVQSDMNNVYVEIRQQLCDGKKVMFTGTPCQVVALRNFLGMKEYDNLVCVDVFCHGISSPGLFDKYLEECVGISKEKISSISFRSKETSWEKYKMVIESKYDTYKKAFSRDPFLKSFCRKMSLRNSCYNCECKGFPRQSDISLGDFWMVDRIFPSMNDHQGVSMVFVNTEKGEHWVGAIRKNTECKEIKREILEDVYRKSGTPVEKPSDREQFFNEVNKNGLKNASKKYGNIPLPAVIRNKIRIFLISVGVYDRLRKIKKRTKNA